MSDKLMNDAVNEMRLAKFLESVAINNTAWKANIGTGRSGKFEEEVRKVLMEVDQMLIDKNRKYGDSALNPVRLFSRAAPIEQLKVRLDDKLSRLRSGQTDDTEDVELDIMGYLVMLRIAKLKEVK